MGLIDSLPTWLGGRPPRAAAPPCPTEADILNYAEQRLPAPTRHELEQHIAACADCRELLVLLARFPESEIAELNEADRAEMLAAMNLKEPALAVLAREAYKLLGLHSFFTAGPDVDFYQARQRATGRSVVLLQPATGLFQQL